MSFVKLHGSILHSSIWAEAHATRIVWITMLAMADENGIVAASVGGLKRAAVVSTEECKFALDVLLSPDPDSRDGTSGERIEKVPGGWLVLNHQQYRDRRTKAQVATAERVARHRARQKGALPVTKSNGVTDHLRISPSEAEAEAEVEAEQKKKTRPRRSAPATKPDDVPEEVWDDWATHRRGKRATVSETALKGIVREAKKAGMTLTEALETSISQGWQGFKAEWVKERGAAKKFADTEYTGGTGKTVRDL